MGIVFDIQKFSVQDGPGIRTSVFLKGCNLSCIWCHNPESIKEKPQLAFEESLCVHCGTCLKVCTSKVHSFNENMSGHQVDFEHCVACGTCATYCVSNALKMFGKEYSVTDVMEEIESDRIYYENSGGGVTFTGGEPTIQFDFLIKLLKECKKARIHICVETNGIINNKKRKELAEYVDLFLIDYKATPSARHKELTGVGSEEVLKTLDYLSNVGKPIVLRCPMIPGINDSAEHMAEIRRIKTAYPNIQKVEVMSYHSTGRKKWESIGVPYQLENLETASVAQKKKWEDQLID